MEIKNYDCLLNKKIKKVYTVYDDELHFEFENGQHYLFYHEQDCCESVLIEDICGDISQLTGKSLCMAEETSESDEDDYGTCTWTFYKFASPNMYVTVRWFGESNGYYSESVDFMEITSEVGEDG
jgi:hypothetical protein